MARAEVWHCSYLLWTTKELQFVEIFEKFEKNCRNNPSVRCSIFAMTDQCIGQVSKYESLAQWWIGSQSITVVKTYHPLSKLLSKWYIESEVAVTKQSERVSLSFCSGCRKERGIWKKELMHLTSTGEKAGEIYFYICLYKIHENFQERRWL